MSGIFFVRKCLVDSETGLEKIDTNKTLAGWAAAAEYHNSCHFINNAHLIKSAISVI